MGQHPVQEDLNNSLNTLCFWASLLKNQKTKPP